MIVRRRWGELVQRGFARGLPLVAVGCASTPEPKPVPSAPVVAVASSSPAPVARAPMPAGLSELHVALSVPADPHTYSLRSTSAMIRFGAGALAHTAIDWRSTPPVCPLSGEGACALYAVSRDGVTWTEALRAPTEWQTFSPGAAVVYAAGASADRLAVDAIDAQGKSTRWLDRPDEKGLTSIQIVETATETFMLAEDEDAFVAEIVGPAGARTLGARVPLKARTVENRPNAQGARGIDGQGMRASWGERHPFVVHGAMGRPTGQWAFVWTRVIAPPYGVPAGKEWRRRERRGAKHDCSSGPPSRKLSDPSVEKRVMLTVLEGTKVVRDVVIDGPATLDLDARALAVTPSPDGVVVEGVAYDLEGKRQKGVEPAPPPKVAFVSLAATIPDEERVTGLAYDTRASEGLALFSRGGEDSFARRFDADGAFVGEPFALHDGIGAHPSSQPVRLARIGDVWLGYDEAEQRVAWITGPHAGRVQELRSPGRLLGVLPDGHETAQIVFDENGQHVSTFAVGVVAGVVGERRETKLKHALTAFVRASDGVPLLLESPTMRLVALRTGDATEPPEALLGLVHPVVFDLGDDVLLEGVVGGQRIAMWLGTGATAVVPADPFTKESSPPPGPPAPPVRPSGWIMGPQAVGAWGTPFIEAYKACPHSVLVGRGVAVLGCSEATHPTIPGVRAGLRTLRLF